MTRFTKRHYKKMMQQVPTEQREVHGPPAFPPSRSCSYGQDASCLGLMRGK